MVQQSTCVEMGTLVTVQPHIPRGVAAVQPSIPQGITHRNITGGRKEPRQLASHFPTKETHHVTGKLVFQC